MHESPTPTPGSSAETRQDARTRGLRSLAQALAVTVLVGAATAVAELATTDSVLTLATVGTTAGTGALMALAAYVQRRLGK